MAPILKWWRRWIRERQPTTKVGKGTCNRASAFGDAVKKGGAWSPLDRGGAATIAIYPRRKSRRSIRDTVMSTAAAITPSIAAGQTDPSTRRRRSFVHHTMVTLQHLGAFKNAKSAVGT
jgi:hypothetical protein